MLGKLFKRVIKSEVDKSDSATVAEESYHSRGNKGKGTKGNKVGKTKNVAPGRNQNPKGGKRPHQQSRQNPPASDFKPWDISQFQVPEIQGKTRFHDLGLAVELMHAIADQGFEYCSPIQAQSLPYSLNGHDMVGKAQTGTGKTAAFLTHIIDDLIKHPLQEDRYAGEARVLIIAPTRELVMQIAEDAVALCKYTDLKVHALVGGMDYGKQQRRLHDTLVDILVATPGRLLDFCGNKDVYLDQVEILVIDEADRMLDMGFIPQVRRIIRQTPKKTHRQTLLFSATFTPDVLRLSEQWTLDPVKVEIEPENVAIDTVEQHVYLSTTEEKYMLLYNILQQQDVESLIVFANRRDECRDLHEKLERHGFNVGLLSGEISQNKRVRTLEAFKSGRLKVLVATDVAGRGIHIEGISHVVNFTLPDEPEDYVHRIGRTGRAGKSGTSISFACEDDAFRLLPIQELLGGKVKCVQPPEMLLIEPPPLAPRKKSPARNGRKSSHRTPRSR